MKEEKTRLSDKSKKKLLKQFGISAGITLAVCIVVMIGVLVVYNNTIGNQKRTTFVDEPLTEDEKQKEAEKDEKEEINTTIAVFGVDQDEVRTDVIFVVNFNSMTNKVKVINIPRDTKVFWSDRQKSKYTQLTGYSITQPTKLNEMSAYGQIYKNPGNIRDFTIDEIENILKVRIDNYVIINIEAFNKIVDAIGGVEVTVPSDLYYDDFEQNLHINIKAGYQTLNGKDAEGLVRYRQYKNGDVDRISVQQVFLKAFAQKVLSPAVFNNVPLIVTSLFSYVKTDIQLTQILEYLELLNSFDLTNLEFHTLPGNGSMVEGPSYYYIDEEETDKLVREVFYDTDVAEKQETSEPTEPADESDEIEIDMSVSVEIYNATDVKGLAGTLKDKLSKKGYNVAYIGNYKDGTLKDTTIYAKDTAKAKQFSQYLEGADIVRDSTLDYDIKIVIGEESAKSF